MEKIPTAEEFYESIVGVTPDAISQHSCTLEVIIGFAKLHVKAALLAASEQAEAKENPADYGTGSIWVDKKSILNAYPLYLIE